MKVREVAAGSSLYEKALALRFKLFFQQHHLPKTILLDVNESSSRHFIIAQGNDLLAYGRLTQLDSENYKISQMVVQENEQGKGYGSMILDQMLKVTHEQGAAKVSLNARLSAAAFYKNHGFSIQGKKFLSKTTGVPHIKMLYVASN